MVMASRSQRAADKIYSEVSTAEAPTETSVPQQDTPTSRRKKWLLGGSLALLAIAIGVGVGVGVGVSTKHHAAPQSYGDNEGGSDDALPIITIDSPSNTSASVEGDFWRPSASETWQIVLSGRLSSDGRASDFPTNASVYDIDLFDTPASTISTLHAEGRHIICYFSAGSYEDWRPDAQNFTSADYGNALKGWKGEWWLNTSSSNVRKIMRARLDLAIEKGCDGVDPDNVDGYDVDNDSGLELTRGTAVEYMTFLAVEAHGRNLSIGLKNANAIVESTVYMMQWSVNEQCSEYGECAEFRPFIDLGKPVFHIEYPNGAPEVPEKDRSAICGDQDASGFSTVMKEMSLNWWTETCDGS